eukprot:CAMPEP_0194341804 /NCGR_PEP_ID=MMETSP0171-20130528/90827_1 /TAXON_ID=218684 /ORGANISM="Corethron pennatum, Strain L29A3" /LENGTH=50 /DNA_ID=CAMNT_0039107279 /DNA_START=104 /DNA_END=253 /DNA_ORIENTATION=-
MKHDPGAFCHSRYGRIGVCSNPPSEDSSHLRVASRVSVWTPAIDMGSGGM